MKLRFTNRIIRTNHIVRTNHIIQIHIVHIIRISSSNSLSSISSGNGASSINSVNSVSNVNSIDGSNSISFANLPNLAKIASLLAVLFAAFWLLFPFISPTLFWPIFALLAIAWFVYECDRNKKNMKRIYKALKIGLLLVFANLIINYYFGFAQRAYIIEASYSLFFVLGNPIELLTGSFFGGAAWFLRLPKKFNKIYSAADVVLLASLGTLTEIMLIENNLLAYVSVDSLNAFLTYALVWTILHFVYYKVLK